MFKKLRFLPILIMALVLAVIAFSPAGTSEAGNKIADGVYLGDQDLSGKTMGEAADAMEAYYEKIAASDLTINVRKLPSDVLKKLEAGEAVDTSKYDVVRTVKVPVSTFDFDYSIEEALRVASTLGQTGRLVERYKTLMDMKYGRAQLPLSYSVNGEKVKEYVEKVFAPENTKDPVDAKFSWGKDGLQVRQKEQDGIKVYNNLTVNAILQAFENGISDSISCTVAVGAVPATVTADSLTNIKFGRVATYTTKFWRGNDESSSNRSHNIDLAARYVNGTMINPGQRASLNQLIGMRTPERGFKVGKAFYNGKVVDDYGGGVCQFATTFYQCLLQTELTVNVRYNHSLAVTYVDYSQDATLDWGYCDLVFTNNWNNPIYVECSTTYNTVTVSFYGVDERPKNRTVEYKSVVDEEIKTVYPAIVLEDDKAPAYPTREGQVLPAVKSHIEKIVRVNGVVQSTTKMNNDYYRPLRANVHVGTKGLKLTVKRENDIDKIYDQNGNQLLMNTKYEPIYNGRGGYYLAKDYKHDADGVAVYSGGQLVPVSSAHTHSYGSWSSNNNGTHSRSCSCGDKQTENCNFDSNGKCTVCGYTKPTNPPTQPSTEPTTAHTHSYSWASNGNGTHNGTCSGCGDKITNEACSYDSNGKCTKCGYTKPAETQHEHNYTGWTSNGDKTHTGTCSCGDKKTWPCDFNDVVTPPTTTTQGYTTHTCKVCGYSYVDSYTDPVQPTTEPTTQATEPDPNPGGEGGEGGGEGSNP